MESAPVEILEAIIRPLQDRRDVYALAIASKTLYDIMSGGYVKNSKVDFNLELMHHPLAVCFKSGVRKIDAEYDIPKWLRKVTLLKHSPEPDSLDDIDHLIILPPKLKTLHIRSFIGSGALLKNYRFQLNGELKKISCDPFIQGTGVFNITHDYDSIACFNLHALNISPGVTINRLSGALFGRDLDIFNRITVKSMDIYSVVDFCLPPNVQDITVTGSVTGHKIDMQYCSNDLSLHLFNVNLINLLNQKPLKNLFVGIQPYYHSTFDIASDRDPRYPSVAEIFNMVKYKTTINNGGSKPQIASCIKKIDFGHITCGTIKLQVVSKPNFIDTYWIIMPKSGDVIITASSPSIFIPVWEENSKSIIYASAVHTMFRIKENAEFTDNIRQLIPTSDLL